MPVRHLVEENSSLLAFYFFGKVTLEEIEGAINRIAADSKTGITYQSVLVFHGSTDLSRIGPDELKHIKSVLRISYDDASIERPAGAIVVDGSLDAKIITPLWKAMCDADSEMDVHYRFFIDIAPALAWLDVVETPALEAILKDPN